MWRDTLHMFGNALTARNAAVPPGVIGSAARFDVYRNNVAWGLMNALAEAYPVVLKLTGQEFFDTLAHAYTQKNRPASPVLHEYGADFGDFIETFDAAQSLPFLADIARLERYWLEAYHAADHSWLHLSLLSAVPEKDIDHLRLGLHPSLRLFRSRYPAVSIWQAHQATEFPDLSTIASEPEQAVIVRPALDVHVHPVAREALDFYSALAKGIALGEACAAVRDTDEGDPSAWLADLFAMGAVSRLDQPET